MASADRDSSKGAAPAGRRRPTVRRMIYSILFIVLGVYVGLLLIGCAAQEALIFPRSFANAQPRAAPLQDAEVLHIEPEPGVRVEAWLLPGDGCTPETPGPAVIFFHGNAERIDNCIAHAREYQRRGVTVLLPEYRGYGDSGGRPSQRAIVSDMRRMRELLDACPEVDAARVSYHGRSLGGGVAAQLALHAPPSRLVLESTFTSVVSFAHRHLVPGFIIRHPFRTDRALPQITCPILVLHGRDDEIVPVAHARTLADAAPNATLVELAGGHNDFPRDWQEYWISLDRFAEENR